MTPRDAQDKAERRTSPRVAADVSLRLAGRRFYITYKGDVSAGGVFLTTAIPLARGERVELKFVLPDRTEIDAEGVVLNQRPEEAGLGVGVKFTKMDARCLEALKACIAAQAGG